MDFHIRIVYYIFNYSSEWISDVNFGNSGFNPGSSIAKYLYTLINKKSIVRNQCVNPTLESFCFPIWLTLHMPRTHEEGEKKICDFTVVFSPSIFQVID